MNPHIMCRDHDLAFRAMTELVPELRTKMFVSSSDDEFTKLLSTHLTGSFVSKCENHLTKQIGRYVIIIIVNLNIMNIIIDVIMNIIIDVISVVIVIINIIVIVSIIIIIVMLRWCETRGKATKQEVSFYKNEFR